MVLCNPKAAPHDLPSPNLFSPSLDLFVTTAIPSLGELHFFRLGEIHFVVVPLAVCILKLLNCIAIKYAL